MDYATESLAVGIFATELATKLCYVANIRMTTEFCYVIRICNYHAMQFPTEL